ASNPSPAGSSLSPSSSAQAADLATSIALPTDTSRSSRSVRSPYSSTGQQAQSVRLVVDVSTPAAEATSHSRTPTGHTLGQDHLFETEDNRLHPPPSPPPRTHTSSKRVRRVSPPRCSSSSSHSSQTAMKLEPDVQQKAHSGSVESHSQVKNSHDPDLHVQDLATTPSPLGFNRLELVRLLVQSLQSLGYPDAAKCLEAESGHRLESPAVSRFRECLLAGNWAEVERLISELGLDPIQTVPTVKFLIREQKFLELLEARQIKSALVVLRSELTPLNLNIERVHSLTSFMMSSSAVDLRKRANWSGAEGQSRQQLLTSLQSLISPSIMVPENRLETMLQQAITLQINNCLYHDNRNIAKSLYSDHICEKTGIPTVVRRTLGKHKNEVWHVSFSHDGRFLASASADSRIIIWNVQTFEQAYTLQGHASKVTWCAWSPDDTKILSTGIDRTVNLWDVQNEQGDVQYTWPFPVRDVVISSDGKTLVAMCGTLMRVISLEDMSELSKLEETYIITAISLSKDGRYLLANTTAKPTQPPQQREIHLWNLAEGRIERRYVGYKQGLYIIRSCFGGWDDRFVVSGSEDSTIYIWHRDNGNLIQTLVGHLRPVTSVAWNPVHPTMFASASDDTTIRIWGTEEDVENDQAGALSNGNTSYPQSLQLE
ncbi:hypothetical protein BGZ94_009615, partial [Podila epigama]